MADKVFSGSSLKMWTVIMVLVLASSFVLQTQASGSSMTVYAMAVGQGDGNIIDCPNGRDILIVDMGAKSPPFTTRVYGAYLLKEKFGVLSKNKNIHIVVSHPHNDHYNQLTSAIDNDLVPQVSEIVLGGTVDNYSSYFVKWLREKNFPVYTINNGLKCFGNDKCVWTKEEMERSSSNRQFVTKKSNLPFTTSTSQAGDPWQFCSNDVTITALAANIGGNSEDLNMVSVILRLAFNKWSLLMSGDFEGESQQKELIEQHSNALQSDYYKVAHHGSWTSSYKANLPELLAYINPKRVYVSQGYPSLSKYHHPNCVTVQHLLALRRLETVEKGKASPLMCWNHTTLSVESVFQGGQEYAIYETCSMLKNDKHNQVCRDIMIETNGYSDQTEFVNVPSEYVR